MVAAQELPDAVDHRGHGDSDWPKVLAALDEVGYAGWMIAEQYRIPGMEDAAWLGHLAKKMDSVIAS